MFALQKIAGNSPRLVNVMSQQVRKEHIMGTKPRNKISTPEKIAHATFMTLCVMATPIWVMLHFGEYKNKKD